MRTEDELLLLQTAGVEATEEDWAAARAATAAAATTAVTAADATGAARAAGATGLLLPAATSAALALTGETLAQRQARELAELEAVYQQHLLAARVRHAQEAGGGAGREEPSSGGSTQSGSAAPQQAPAQALSAALAAGPRAVPPQQLADGLAAPAVNGTQLCQPALDASGGLVVMRQCITAAVSKKRGRSAEEKAAEQAAQQKAKAQKLSVDAKVKVFQRWGLVATPALRKSLAAKEAEKEKETADAKQRAEDKAKEKQDDTLRDAQAGRLLLAERVQQLAGDGAAAAVEALAGTLTVQQLRQMTAAVQPSALPGKSAKKAKHVEAAVPLLLDWLAENAAGAPAPASNASGSA